ncbi:type 1 pili tip component [Allohahella sp. A8]|jgi:hypothetical protein|uniref:type 1 pili tip component n=1 Tax=Allohahella sp. A8 TaxID=3141461 RepID=UPI000C0B9897|nr:type 1 pili tip component [Hahellaceae bacterium]|tara:strand:+ start:32516 stop:32857 length:342 start_codon:yes stop_codon:yes gene_type:complete
MNINALVNHWEDTAKVNLTHEEYTMRLRMEDAARIAALAEMYPRRSQGDIISELLAAAIDELESSMPYVEGRKVIGCDEMGDPMYEDVGPTPRFLELSRKYMSLMKQNRAANG